MNCLAKFACAFLLCAGITFIPPPCSAQMLVPNSSGGVDIYPTPIAVPYSEGGSTTVAGMIALAVFAFSFLAALICFIEFWDRRSKKYKFLTVGLFMLSMLSFVAVAMFG